jgi:hypothetical protein
MPWLYCIQGADDPISGLHAMLVSMHILHEALNKGDSPAHPFRYGDSAGDSAVKYLSGCMVLKPTRLLPG